MTTNCELLRNFIAATLVSATITAGIVMLVWK